MTQSDCLLNISTSGLVFKNFWLKKANNVQAFGMKIQGNANYFDNIHSRGENWVSFIYGVAVKESHFSRIRVDNDPTNNRGTIFEFNYSINNTISDSFIGYAVNGILLNNVPAPTNHDNPTAYYNEGLMIDNTTIVKCNVAVNVRHGTSINISNSVLDFCGDYGICLDAGQALMITNTWIAVTGARGTSVGVYDNSTSKFREIIINGNELVGTPSENQQKAFNLTNSNINVSINNNILQSLNGGTAFSKEGSISNNVIPDGTPITGYPKFTTKTFYPTQQAKDAFQVRSAIIELFASVLGTDKTLKATGNVDASGNIHLHVDASNGIKLGSFEPTTGTVSVYTDEGNYTKMLLVAKVYPYDHLSN